MVLLTTRKSGISCGMIRIIRISSMSRFSILKIFQRKSLKTKEEQRAAKGVMCTRARRMINREMLRAGMNVVVLAVLLARCAAGQTSAKPQNVNCCDVVASPADYNGKVLSIEVVLSPGEHSLVLYGDACLRKEGYDDSTQEILPDSWESLPNGKKLRAILKHGRDAKVKLVGTFESGQTRYGPDVARFRFSISQANSVSRWNGNRAGGGPSTR